MRAVPAAYIWPLRGDTVWFAWRANFVVPLPVPDAPDVMDIQGTWDVAVQIHDGSDAVMSIWFPITPEAPDTSRAAV